MKTARELLRDNFLLIEDDNTCEAHTHLVVNQMIEFAKLHVEACKEEIKEKLEQSLYSTFGVSLTDDFGMEISGYNLIDNMYHKDTIQ